MDRLLRLPIGVGASSSQHGLSAGDSAVLSATGEIKIPTRGLSRSSGGVGVNLGSSGDGDGVDSDDDSTSASSLFAPSRANAVVEGGKEGEGGASRPDAPRDICAICTVQFAKYTCPKCGIAYV